MSEYFDDDFYEYKNEQADKKMTSKFENSQNGNVEYTNYKKPVFSCNEPLCFCGFGLRRDDMIYCGICHGLTYYGKKHKEKEFYETYAMIHNLNK